MKRTTLVNAEGPESQSAPAADGGRQGTLKVFFSYAPCSGTTAAMLDEAQGLMGSGRDVFVADADPSGSKARSFDLDQVLKRRPDVVVLENLALPNPPEARNRTRYQDAEELLRAGIDVYATLRVTDLENERDRIVALGADVPPESVPDYMLYRAAQLEFVDIDPAELVVRAKTAGREVPVAVLNELRVLALRCVSEYAATAGMSREAPQGEDGEEPQHATHDCVVAVVAAQQGPGRVLLEASRLAMASHAQLEAVCVRRAPRSGAVRAQSDEEAYTVLGEQVDAMGLTLTTCFGDDEADTVRDFLRARGATDVVLGRRRLSLLRRLLLPAQLPFEDRIVEGLSGVRVHIVVGDEAPGDLRAKERRLAVVNRPRVRDLLLALAFCAFAFCMVRLLQMAGFSEGVSYVVYLGTFVALAVASRSYAPSLMAVAGGCLCLDYFFIRPYNAFSIDHRASLMLLALFAAVSVASVVGVARVGRAADRADQRERRTQALFDLNRSLLYAHGRVEVVDLALDAVARLFNRSAVMHLADPFDAPASATATRHAAGMRCIPGDLDGAVFEKVTEQAVVHWVFTNGVEAGGGTDTHGESDVLYLPLLSSVGMEGALGVSVRRDLSLADRSFLDLIATQVSYALERQSLSSKHDGDLSVMAATGVRSSFVAGLVASTSVSNGTVHALSDALTGASDDERAWRDALARAISDESARSRLMVDRMQTVLSLPVRPECDVRAEVAAAIDEVREGLSGKVIGLAPGRAIPPITADAALVRTAVKLILEASTSYVGMRGIIDVSVESYADRVSVVVADNRAAESSNARSAAFELASRTGGEDDLTYDEARANQLRVLLLDKETVTGDQQRALAALCQALRLPESVAHPEGDPHGPLNRQRILRFDRLEYGLYMAALIARAHGGTIKQRYRLGGGAVVTLTLPRP